MFLVDTTFQGGSEDLSVGHRVKEPEMRLLPRGAGQGVHTAGVLRGGIFASGSLLGHQTGSVPLQAAKPGAHYGPQNHSGTACSPRRAARRSQGSQKAPNRLDGQA